MWHVMVLDLRLLTTENIRAELMLMTLLIIVGLLYIVHSRGKHVLINIMPLVSAILFIKHRGYRWLRSRWGMYVLLLLTLLQYLV